MRRSAGWGVVACSVAVSSLLVGCGGEPVAAPTSFGLYNCKDGTFECAYPENWEAKGGSKKIVWAKFSSGPALISIKGDLAGSVMAETTGAVLGASGEPLPPQLEPVHMLHVEYKESTTEDYDGYTETAGPNVHQCNLGPARLSEFDYSTAFGTAMHGYRATILAKDRALVVFCVCPTSDWATLKPGFDKVLASFARGTAEL